MLSLIDVVTYLFGFFAKIPSLKMWRKRRYRHESKKRVLFHSSEKLGGSLTVEGSMVLPLFLFFMMTILLSLEMVRFQSNIQEALHQVGNESAFIGGISQSEGREKIDPGSGIRAYIREQLYPYLCVAGGEDGLMVEDYSTIEENGVIHIEVRYQMKPFIVWLPIGELCFEDSIYSHAWTGFCGKEVPGSDITEPIYVYVTETGSRYHLSGECTYLRIQVKSVDHHMLSSIRNESGEKYSACERCHPGKDGIVFLTSNGNRYHGSADCSSLRRTVRLILLEEAVGYSPCSKCVT